MRRGARGRRRRRRGPNRTLTERPRRMVSRASRCGAFVEPPHMLQLQRHVRDEPLDVVRAEARVGVAAEAGHMERAVAEGEHGGVLPYVRVAQVLGQQLHHKGAGPGEEDVVHRRARRSDDGGGAGKRLDRLGRRRVGAEVLKHRIASEAARERPRDGLSLQDVAALVDGDRAAPEVSVRPHDGAPRDGGTVIESSIQVRGRVGCLAHALEPQTKARREGAREAREGEALCVNHLRRPAATLAHEAGGREAIGTGTAHQSEPGLDERTAAVDEDPQLRIRPQRRKRDHKSRQQLGEEVAVVAREALREYEQLGVAPHAAHAAIVLANLPRLDRAGRALRWVDHDLRICAPVHDMPHVWWDEEGSVPSAPVAQLDVAATRRNHAPNAHCVAVVQACGRTQRFQLGLTVWPARCHRRTRSRRNPTESPRSSLNVPLPPELPPHVLVVARSQPYCRRRW
mmetsp:Transcript_3797/g.12113  ORF Transcript_3797/g.12113 Transcript_3797/m.12113 type:complete len:456 (+) Transcript_3797:1571-2938(+)